MSKKKNVTRTEEAPATTSTEGGGCVFDSYYGVFPNGYCVWKISPNVPPQLLSCHCKLGYVCGESPGTPPQYGDQIVKKHCVPKSS